MTIFNNIDFWLSRKILAILRHLEYQQHIIEQKRIHFKNFPKDVSFGKISQICSPECISVGEKTGFGDWVFLTAWSSFRCIIDGKETIQNFMPDLTIGENCYFGAFNHITCINKIKIGNRLLTGKWVTITDNSHGNTDINTLNTEPIKRPLY